MTGFGILCDHELSIVSLFLRLVDSRPQRAILCTMRVADFKSWLPIAIAVIAAMLLYYAISGRCGELLGSSAAP